MDLSVIYEVDQEESAFYERSDKWSLLILAQISSVVNPVKHGISVQLVAALMEGIPQANINGSDGVDEKNGSDSGAATTIPFFLGGAFMANGA